MKLAFDFVPLFKLTSKNPGVRRSGVFAVESAEYRFQRTELGESKMIDS
jgi:soluble lytic murein transglycosylase-like protein